MRKWILATVACLAVLTASIYIFIPSNIEISKVVILNCTATGAYRNLSDETKWSGWGLVRAKNLLSSRSDYTFQFGSIYYSIVEKLRNELVVQIENGDFKINSHINLIAKGTDSVIIVWRCAMPSGRDPVNRIRSYREAVHISDNMRNILQQVRGFLENQTNVYGITISPSSITDTCLLAKKYIFPDYPTAHDISEAVSGLKTFAVEHGTFMNGKPMMNVDKQNDHSFQTMIAIPVNRDMSITGEIFSRRMVPGRFMITDVTGGTYTVNRAIEQLQLYFSDYQKTSMAIPFQSLMTDRNTEPDTSKWLTRLYAPVLQ
jgi:hypothetical protein